MLRSACSGARRRWFVRGISLGVALAGSIAPACAPAPPDGHRRALLELDAEPHAIEPGDELRLDVEAPAKSWLAIDVRSDDRGGLARLTIVGRDPATGALEPLGEASIALGADAAEPLPLPRYRGPLELALRWDDTATSPLHVHALDLLDPRPEPPGPIVFVSIDALAARNMSLHGYERETTPRLDELAPEFVIFERCKANAPWTLPSYLSQMSGLYPDAHKYDRAWVRGGENWRRFRMTPERWTLAESLVAAGYRTAGFVENPFLESAEGIADGFQHYDVEGVPQGEHALARGGRDVFPRALKWIENVEAGRPWFVFINVLDVHGPYLPSAPFAGRFRPARGGDLWVRRGIDRFLTYGDVPQYLIRTGRVRSHPEDSELFSHADLLSSYDEGVLELDHLLGGFLDALRERPDWDRMTVVISADHGESTTQHEFYFQHALLNEQTLHVPLMIKLPGGRGAGRRIDETVPLVDIHPTLLELAGLQAERPQLHGRSLLDRIESSAPPRRIAYSAGSVFDQRSIELGGWKLVVEDVTMKEPTLVLSSPYYRGLFLDAFFKLAPIVPELREAWPDLLKRKAEVRAAILSGADVDELLPMSLRDAAARDEIFRNDALRKRVVHFFKSHGPRKLLYHLPSDPNEERNLAVHEPDRVQRLYAMLERETARASAATTEGESGGGDFDEATVEALGGLGYTGDE